MATWYEFAEDSHAIKFQLCVSNLTMPQSVESALMRNGKKANLMNGVRRTRIRKFPLIVEQDGTVWVRHRRRNGKVQYEKKIEEV